MEPPSRGELRTIANALMSARAMREKEDGLVVGLPLDDEIVEFDPTSEHLRHRRLLHGFFFRHNRTDTHASAQIHSTTAKAVSP